MLRGKLRLVRGMKEDIRVLNQVNCRNGRSWGEVALVVLSLKNHGLTMYLRVGDTNLWVTSLLVFQHH